MRQERRTSLKMEERRQIGRDDEFWKIDLHRFPRVFEY